MTAVGAALGFALAAALTSAQVSAEASGYVWLVALALGVPVGAISAFVVDKTLLWSLPLNAVLRSVPILLAGTALGALVGLIAPLAAPFTAALSLMASGALVRARWERSAGLSRRL